MGKKSTSSDVLSYVGMGLWVRLMGLFSAIVWLVLIAIVGGAIAYSVTSTVLRVVICVVGVAAELDMLRVFVTTIIGIVQEIKHNRKLVKGQTKDEVLNDFDTAVVFFDDTLRLGRKYVFGRGCGRIIEYYEINRVYQTVHKTLTEQKRTLDCVLFDGVGACVLGEYTIGKLECRGRSDDELASAFTMMTSIDPNILVQSAATEDDKRNKQWRQEHRAEKKQAKK